jgi:hypothetical protein
VGAPGKIHGRGVIIKFVFMRFAISKCAFGYGLEHAPAMTGYQAGTAFEQPAEAVAGEIGDVPVRGDGGIIFQPHARIWSRLTAGVQEG